MKTNHVGLIALISILFPLSAHALPPLQQAAVERAVATAITQQEDSVHYYVPLVQLKGEESTPGADGPEAGIFWVEIGVEHTYDGNEPIFWSLTSKKVVVETNDGPMGPFLEEINPVIFNEAYRRYASDPRSAKATINQTKQMLTKYYRQVEAEKKAPAAK